MRRVTAEAASARATDAEVGEAWAKAQRLANQAQSHKQAQWRHRRQMRERFDELNQHVKDSAARGIRITIHAEAEGGHSVRS